MTRYHVLGDGFVEIDRISDSEYDVCRRARISTVKIKKNFSSTEKLIRYLWLNEHTSPFGFPEIVLLIRAPMFVYQQWIRHRTAVMNDGGDVKGFVESTDTTSHQYNDQQVFSGRYAQYDDAMYLPDVETMQKQATSNNQGRSDDLVDNADDYRTQMYADQKILKAHYSQYLEAGLAREVARINTPLSQYIEFYWKQNLVNTLHWLKLRRHTTAQYEIREYAKVIEEIVRENFPATYSAWLEDIESPKLTKTDQEELLRHLQGKKVSPALYSKLGLKNE